MIDKELLHDRFSASLDSYDSAATIQNQVCTILAQMMGRICSEPTAAFEIGAGTGLMTRRLTELYPKTHWHINDLTQAAEVYLCKATTAVIYDFIWGDAEQIDLPKGLDMIVSTSTVQWFDNLPKFLDRAYSSLAQGSYLCLSTFGEQNFKEIKAATGKSLDYYTAEELEGLVMDSGFELLELREFTKPIEFRSPINVLRHIKATGVNSIDRTKWTSKELCAFESRYRELFSVRSAEGSCGSRSEISSEDYFEKSSKNCSEICSENSFEKSFEKNSENCSENNAENSNAAKPDTSKQSSVESPVTLTYHPIIFVARKR